DVEVTLVAGVPGPQHGELRVQSRLTAATVTLAGTAHAPALEVQEGLDFDMVRVRSWARAPLRVRSITDQPMVVQMVLRDEEHAFIVDTAALALDAGQELALSVSFAPPGRGSFEGLLELRACPDCPPHTVSLRGAGAEAQLAASGPSVDFGSVTPGRSLA